MDRQIRLLLSELGERQPEQVALVKHSRQSLARFHPLADFSAWLDRYRSVVADLRARGVDVVEIDGDKAPAHLTGGEALAEWAADQLPRPYRLGMSIGRLGDWRDTQVGIGYAMLWLGEEKRAGGTIND